MVDLGNAGRSHYRASIRAIEENSRLTWDMLGRQEAFVYNRPGVTRVFQHYDSGKTPTGTGMTNLAWVKSRFDKALYYHNQNPDNYQYGCYLLIEEVWHPSLMASWGERPMSGWNIEGTIILPNGSVLEALKPWYIRTKGSWNQTWWDSVKASNSMFEPTVKSWSAYYGYTLLKAWHEYMHSLGKKSALLGLCGFKETNFRDATPDLYFPGQMFDYVIQNYDFITTGIHPKTLLEIPKDIEWLTIMRNEWGYKGKIAHILTSCWSDCWGCPWNMEVAKEDMRQALPYVDIVLVTPFADNSDWMIPDLDIPNHVKYPPLLVQFYDEYYTCPPSQCNFTITQ